MRNIDLWRGGCRFLKRLVMRLLQVAGLLCSILIILFVLLPEWRRAVDDPPYASRVFEGLVPVSRVIASRQWHPRGAEPWDCTFAVVDLGATAPPQPPADRRDLGWPFLFGGDWTETPALPLGGNSRDALGTCSQNFDEETARRLSLALAQPGSWYARDKVGETALIYSPPHGIAAKIRFGD